MSGASILAAKTLLTVPRYRNRVPLCALPTLASHLDLQCDDLGLADDGFADESIIAQWIQSSTSIATADEAIDELQEHFSHNGFRIEWHFGTGSEMQCVPSGMAKCLEAAFRGDEESISGQGWSVTFDPQPMLHLDDGRNVKLSCRAVPTPIDEKVHFNASYRTRSSREISKWELGCMRTSLTVDLDPLLSFELECLLDDWRERGSHDLSIAATVGEVRFTIFPSRVRAWEIVFAGSSRRWELLRFVMDSDDADSDVPQDTALAEAASVYNSSKQALSEISFVVQEAVSTIQRDGFFLLTDKVSVHDVKEILRMPFVDPKSFRYEKAVLTRSMLVRGIWVSMCPLNEWMLDQGEESIFIDGRWYPCPDGAVRLDDGSIVWIRRDNEEKRLRIICRGVPLSVDRRLLTSSSPTALFGDDVVLVDEFLTPEIILRTWRGDRSNADAIEYFGLGKARTNTLSDLSRHGLRLDDRRGDGQTSRFVKKILAAGKYDYKYPVTVNSMPTT